MLEKESGFIPHQYDLNNEDILTRILESGTLEELEQVRDFHKLTFEQMKLFSQYAKLRKQTREQMWEQVKERENQNPTPTQEELEMGCYIESIEPQVRAAVLNLRRKGYATYESGFHNFKGQKIGFEKKHLENFRLPKNLIHELELKGIIVKINSDSLAFSCSRYLELEELKEIWKQIENILPDLQKPAEPCKLRAAQSFRERLKK